MLNALGPGGIRACGGFDLLHVGCFLVVDIPEDVFADTVGNESPSTEAKRSHIWQPAQRTSQYSDSTPARIGFPLRRRPYHVLGDVPRLPRLQAREPANSRRSGFQKPMGTPDCNHRSDYHIRARSPV